MKGTVNSRLWYNKGRDFMLKAYTDANRAKSIDDQKSTSGGTFILGDTLVSWFSKKQDSISLSIVEEDYIVVTSCCAQVMWMR